MLKESTKLSKNLFSKLCFKWDEKRECFQIELVARKRFREPQSRAFEFSIK